MAPKQTMAAGGVKTMSNEALVTQDFSISINDYNPNAFCLIRLETDDAGSPEDFTFLYCNDALAKLEGKPKEELLGQRFYSIFPDGNRKWLDYYSGAAFRNAPVEFDELSEEIDLYLHIVAFPTGMDGICACTLTDIKQEVFERRQAAERIEESQSVLRVLSRNFKNVYTVDLNDGSAKVVKLEDEFQDGRLDEVLGQPFPFEPFLGAWISEAVHPDDRQALTQALSLANLREIFPAQDELTGGYRMLIEDHVYNYQYNLCRMDQTGHVVAGFQNIDGIIAEHAAQEAAHRRELEEQFAIIDALSSDFMTIYLANLEDRTATAIRVPSEYGYDEMVRLRGTSFPFEPIMQQWGQAFAHPDDRDRVLQAISIENLRRVFATQDECVGNYRSCETGDYRNYQFKLKKVDDTHVVAGFQNIDDIIEEEREHTEVISSLSTIYSTIVQVDVDTHSYKVLTSVALMGDVAGSAGESWDEVMDAVIGAFMAPEFQAPMREFLDLSTLAQRMADVNTVVAEYQNPAGRWFQARLIAKRRDEAGQLHEVLYVARDYTNEKEKELAYQEQLSHALAAAQQANRAKSTFLNSMSHDIRTPMNAIIGFTALAQTHLDNTTQVQDYLTKISTSSTHLLSLINDILDMSRIESGTVKLDEKPVHIPDLLHDLRTMIQGLVSSKNQNLFIDTQDVVHEDVFCDKLRLNQVLINIVGNAIKYTQPGGDIIIRLVEKPCAMRERTTFEFSVKDNGIGMSEEFLGRIFDTFSREYSSTVSGEQGTGLGMAITKNIVDMMGGDISVESEEGKGSCFTVTLHLRLANEPQKTEPIPELTGARALVVDDDLNTCRSVSKMLRDIQMRPDWSSSGKEAIVRAQDAAEAGDEYKVYIIDYLMPDMNGIETVRRIRKVISDDVPIIVLTAYDWEDFEAEAREAGVTAFVSKPIFMSELRQVLTQPVAEDSEPKDDEQRVEHSYVGKRALLVEDNELNREIACAILDQTGMMLDTVEDGDEAVETIDKAPAGTYDLVLMDIQMPRMDGYTATREIRTFTDNEKANVPIVAMTANAFEEDRQKALEAGMDGHIIKPISLEAITEVLDRVLPG